MTKSLLRALDTLDLQVCMQIHVFWLRKNNHEAVLIAIWADDSLISGNKKAIESTFEGTNNQGYDIKIEGELKNYLIYKITSNPDNTKAWIH